MNHMLFYVGQDTHDWSFYDYSWIDKWCSLYNVAPVVIDLEGTRPKSDKIPYNFRSLEEAVSHPDLKGLKWFWLDHRAQKRWNEVKLPKDGAIYCIGHDFLGFGDFKIKKGTKIKVAHQDKRYEDGEWFASMVAVLLLFEIYH